jgi:hypothetical protein
VRHRHRSAPAGDGAPCAPAHELCISSAPCEDGHPLGADDAPGREANNSDGRRYRWAVRWEGIDVSRRERITKELLVDPGTDANIADRDPAWTGGSEFDERQAMVVAILVDTIGSLDLSWPEVSGQARVANAEARRTLAEPDGQTGGP